MEPVKNKEPFRLPDVEVELSLDRPVRTKSILYLRQLASGRWIVHDATNARGGCFRDRRSALNYINVEFSPTFTIVLQNHCSARDAPGQIYRYETKGAVPTTPKKPAPAVPHAWDQKKGASHV
ncbi:hypothetical protein DFP92_102116 [Yoonia sediminilitoris]|uniref:Uncharacterized protein n=1 Tax=Yoonia sediminilitoris TaxID=1286148 RepID=A0A2T6KLM4_9RHOB|nr:hypothetical protein C8N45_102116 [Yoonia sediminilitoris]RCW97401.1 hypothetical protein DFP92_102116 [Yoonia sediminilitoris]